MEQKKIKIFIDGHSFDKEYQGTHVFIRELYRALAKAHNNLDIYIGARNTAAIRELFPFLPEANILPYKKNLHGLVRLLRDIPAYIKKYDFDFAHFQYIAPRSIKNCKYIVTLHDILFNDFKPDFPLRYRTSRNILFRTSFHRAFIKTTVSPYSKSRIAYHYKLPQEAIQLIPCGVDPHYGNAYTPDEAVAHIQQKFGIRNFILYVSRIEPRKNHLGLLGKYLQMRLYEKGISLVMVGKRSLPVPALEEMLNGLTPEQSVYVHYFEQLDPVDLEAAYMACRLFIYPSRAEGFGIPPLEAALCRVPVLCSSATAMGDFTFFDPFRFDPANEIEMEAKMEDMLDNPPPKAELERIAATINDQYCWDRTAAAFYSLLVDHPSESPQRV